jgi:glucose-1-phosphate adenylyltransferase
MPRVSAIWCACSQNALIIGADYYESEDQKAKVLAEGGVPLGIGAGTTIKNCIVDKNARIGKNVVIENKGGVEVRCSEVLFILTAWF